MSKSLVGFTGFVGSNLATSIEFNNMYNKSNISKAFGTRPDLLIYAGLPAEKYLANNFPEKDFAQCKDAFENIKKINAKKTVLISTIDIFSFPDCVSESSEVITEDLHPYGYNRYCLEQWVKEYDNHALIVRLPALFGAGLKKNFIYDIIHVIPAMLSEEKLKTLAEQSLLIKSAYSRQPNGFFQANELSSSRRDLIKHEFIKSGFTAAKFTDSRAVFQFYWLKHLFRHIQVALHENIQLLHLATEPISADAIYQEVNREQFINEVMERPPYYNFKTEYAALFGGSNGYIYSKDKVLEDLKRFIEEERR